MATSASSEEDRAVAEQWQIEHDRRQYDLIAECIRQYEEGATDLASLIAGVDSLLECL